MKTIATQIVWKIIIIILVIEIGFLVVFPYILEKKSQEQISTNIQYIRDSKFKSINKDNIATAYDLTSLDYNSYIIDEKGKLLITSNFVPDVEVVDFCNSVNEGTKSYAKYGSTKYISVKKNGNLCLVVEGNTNNSILLGSFVRNILSIFIPIFLLVILFFLRRTYKKILNPLKAITENTENALVSKWEKIQPVKTKIEEIKNLDKYTGYIIELLKSKTGSENIEKINEIKQYQNKFSSDKANNEANKFKMAVESSPDIIVIVDKFGYINYANKTLTDLIAIPFREIENKKITDLWHKDDDVNIWKGYFEKVMSEKKSVTFSTNGYKQQNLKFEALVQISPIKNYDDSVQNLLITERDVSEEKQKERIKNEFVSVVSHELRTPMTVIRGYSTLLSDGKLGELNEKQKEYIDRINSETGRLLELANDMLDLQKFNSGKIELKFEKTDIEKFINKIIGDFQIDYTKKGFTLAMESSLKNKFANIDLKYFERVITNLLTNAYKYTDHGGVKIFLINPDENNIVIAVKDTGIGIKDEALPHLFERFYQADGVMNRKQEGSGLGLSIVKTVTEAHSGMTWVESKFGVGSTFYVAIPAAK